LKLYGEPHPNLTSTYANLGALLIPDEKEKALYYLKKSLENNQKIHGEDKSDNVPTYILIGKIYLDNSNYTEAEKYFLQGEEVAKKTSTEMASFMYELHKQLAFVYCSVAKFAEAKARLQKAKILLDTHGLESERMEFLYGQGYVEIVLHNYKEAIGSFEELVELITSKGNLQDPQLLELYQTLADLYGKIGDYAEAKRYQKKKKNQE